MISVLSEGRGKINVKQFWRYRPTLGNSLVHSARLGHLVSEFYVRLAYSSILNGSILNVLVQRGKIDRIKSLLYDKFNHYCSMAWPVLPVING